MGIVLCGPLGAIPEVARPDVRCSQRAESALRPFRQMVPALALLVVQADSGNEAIHDEDARVMEAALVRYWERRLDGRPNSERHPIYYEPETAGPRFLSDAIVLGDGYDEGRSQRAPTVSSRIRKQIFDRNAQRVSLSWFHPTDPRVRPVPQTPPRRDLVPL